MNNYLPIISLFFLWLNCCCPLQSFAQLTLTGTVVDRDEEPIIGATIQVRDSYKSTVTDDKGSFTLGNLSAGDYTLKIQSLGYQPLLSNVNLTEDQNLAFRLVANDFFVDTVFVTATRVGDNEAQAYTNLSAADLQPINLGQDLPILLDQTPSVVTTSDAGTGVGYTGIRIRGSDATRVNITINGIPFNDSESHGTYWVNLPDFTSSVDNIQIQRGIGTSTNGAGAFGGSINLQTTTLNAEAYGEYNGSYGSFNTIKNTVAFGSGLLNKHFTIDGRLSKINSDGYVDRATADLKSFFVSAGYYDKNNILRLNVFSGKEITYQSWYGLDESLLESNRTDNFYTYENEVDNYQQDHYQLHYARRLNSQWNLGLAAHLTNGKGFFEQFKDGEDLADYGLENTSVLTVEEGDTALLTTTDLIRRKWLDNDFYGFTYSLKYNGSKLNAVLGGAWNNYIGDHFGEVIWAKYEANSNIRHRYYDNTGEKMDFNSYLKATYQPSRSLSLFGDFQFRQINYTINGVDEDAGAIDFEQSFTFFNPKVGVNYNLNDNNAVYASFGIGNREPNRSNIIDNTDLPRAEQLQDLEVGVKHRAKAYTLALNGYFMNYKDQLVLTGNLNDVGDPIQQNVEQSYRMGLELMGKVNIFKQLTWDATATFSQNKIKTFTQNTTIFTPDFGYVGDTSIVYTDTDISFSPNIIAASTLTYRPFKGFEMALMSKYVGKQFLDNTSTDGRTLDAYFVNNIRAGYSFKTNLFKEVGINLLVNNVFNSLYESNGYTYFLLFQENGQVTTSDFNAYYPQATTNFLLGLSLKF